MQVAPKSGIAIETCKLNGIEPFAYLCDVLEKPPWPNKKLHEILPWNWKNCITLIGANPQGWVGRTFTRLPHDPIPSGNPTQAGR